MSSSISIRFSSNIKDSDSDEEVSIVRLGKTKNSDQINSQNGKSEGNSEDLYKVTQVTCETDASIPDESSRHAERNEETIEASLNFPHKSLSVPESREAPDKKILAKQNSWPGHTRAEVPESGRIMKFLRGRDREHDKENETKCDTPKEGLSLASIELKEESDAGSLPSKNHTVGTSDKNVKVDEKRPRSPSPFRLLSRDRQVESSTSNDQEKSKSSSSISLSSLLANIGKDEEHNENDDRISDNVEIESNPDVLSDNPSSSELQNSFNFCPDHFDEKVPASKMHPSHYPIDNSPQFANFLLCCLIAYIYFITTWPPFVSGVVFGALTVYFSGCAFLWLFCPQDTRAERYEKELHEYEQRLARTPKFDHKYVHPGVLLKRHELKASIL